MKKILLLLLLCPLMSFDFTDGIDVFLGDSVTFGNELGALQYTARWSTKYTTAENTLESNLAMSGEAMTPGLNPGRPFLNLATLPDYNATVRHLFISFWINDFLYNGTPEKFAAATSVAVTVLVAKGWPASKIVLCFNYLPPATIGKDIALAWRAQLKAVQIAKGTSFLDFYTPIGNRTDNASYSLDGIHPTAEWNTVIDELAQRNIEVPSGPLPSKLLSFSGVHQGSSTVLKWTVAQELNVKAYEVQRSQNGVAWTTVGQVASAGNTNTPRGYNFVDNNTGLKVQYRLRQIDLNGNIEVSKIVFMYGSKPTILTLNSLLPNPTSSALNIIIGAPEKETVDIAIVDMTGRVVQRQQSLVEAGSNTIDMSLDKIAKGTYLIKLTNDADHQSVVSRFVKQ